MVAPVNDKGEYALYANGKHIGYAAMVKIDSALVPVYHADLIYRMKNHAEADGINLTLAVCLRTFEKQINSRKANIIDKQLYGRLLGRFHLQRANEVFEEYIMTAPVDQFKPWTGKPGFSKHQSAEAFDWNVTKFDENGKRIGVLPSYQWLIENAIKYEMIRTIESEQWHFEIFKGCTDMYMKVPKNSDSWKLV